MRQGLGEAIHWVSDELHLLAHWVIGDPDWRARNGTIRPHQLWDPDCDECRWSDPHRQFASTHLHGKPLSDRDQAFIASGGVGGLR